MSVATFQYVRDGQPGFVGYEQTDRTAQDFADRKAARTNPDYADQVLVWFGHRDKGDPDATAEVPA